MIPLVVKGLKSLLPRPRIPLLVAALRLLETDAEGESPNLLGTALR